jgi:hypothetical protein
MMNYTQEDITQAYSAAMDSVNLINAGKPQYMTDIDWAETLERNRAHLRIQVAKGADFYGDLDLTPFIDAIAAD